MYKLDIDYKSILPHVIDAYTHVYGEEYRKIIANRLNDVIFIQYYDQLGIYTYSNYLKSCKKHEFCIRYLEELGIDVSKYKTDNFSELPDFNSDINELLDCTVDTLFGFTDSNFSPLNAFDSQESGNKQGKEQNKVKLINYFLPKDHEKVTLETLEDFCNTEEFQEILERIKPYKQVYEKLKSEFKEWSKQVEPYEKYCDNEDERDRKILEEYKGYLFWEIFDKLPLYSNLDKFLFFENSEIDDDEIKKALGTDDISERTRIEKFSEKDFELLKNKDENIYTKSMIIHDQITYFKSLKIISQDDISFTKPDGSIKWFGNQTEIDKYLEFINQDRIKKHFPSEELITYIKDTREKLYKEAIEVYFKSRKDYQDAINAIGPQNGEYLYHIFTEKKVCMTRAYTGSRFTPIILYTFRIGEGGYLSFTYLHEWQHAIDSCIDACGFETAASFNDDSEKNKSNKKYRRYERFNETLTDIFTQEANNYLRSKGIYLIDPKETTKKDDNNRNTSKFTKDLLKPLIKNYRKQIIKAKIKVDPVELTRYIGQDNYEELIDAINDVDYLVTEENLEYKLKKARNDPAVIKYIELVKKISQIYKNMNDYYTIIFEKPKKEINEIKSVK